MKHVRISAIESYNRIRLFFKAVYYTSKAEWSRLKDTLGGLTLAAEWNDITSNRLLHYARSALVRGELHYFIRFHENERDAILRGESPHTVIRVYATHPDIEVVDVTADGLFVKAPWFRIIDGEFELPGSSIWIDFMGHTVRARCYMDELENTVINGAKYNACKVVWHRAPFILHRGNHKHLIVSGVLENLLEQTRIKVINHENATHSNHS